MIYHPTELMLDDRQREKLQGYDPGFPYTAIDCRFDGYSGPCVDWHWHATLEINVCASGLLKTSTQRGEYIVREGDAVLVNANVLHRNEAYEGAPGVRVQTHMFDRSLVAAAELPQRRYVAPVVECTLLDALPLLRENAEHRAVLEALDRAFAAAGEEKDGYELEICGLLNRAWQGIYALALPVIGARQPLPRMETARLKRMLGFIRDHFAEDISPADIAASAGVCERECFRCFKQELGTTPLATLTDFRLRKAAELLRETDRSVSDIAAACGFANSSYFGKVFRSRMNLSPLAYRRG
ncbi:MAG TPA: AraC family transcriptional regulator [Candidatus Pullichristensenella excrementipullorum]|nr:AraC family transcriptional regulator [Candidatus Pullichristensenella excrementipullorum]